MRRYKQNWLRRFFLTAAMSLMLLPMQVQVELPAVWAAPVAAAAETSLSKSAALRPGDTIGILAPGTNDNIEDYDRAIRDLQKRGYKIKVGTSCRSRYGYFAGTDSTRAADLNRFFGDDEVQAILCLRGGYGSVRMLDKLDYALIASHPKQFIGYSDVTALHIALGEKSRLSTVHGPMLSSFEQGLDEKNDKADTFLRGLQGELYPGDLPLPPKCHLETVQPGRAEGIIMGGNLSVLISLLGTPYEMKGDGALLLIEDVGEDTYCIDRMLWQLWQNGLLSRVNGILVGDMLGVDEEWEEGDFRLSEVLEHYAKLAGKPMIKGLPVGHGQNNVYLPLGIHAVMEAQADGSASLKLDAATTQTK